MTQQATTPVHYLDVLARSDYKPNFTIAGDFHFMPGLLTLPDPHVDVYVKKRHTEGMVLARLMEDKKRFSVAAFYGHHGKSIPISYVERWDYAVPASDLLV